MSATHDDFRRILRFVENSAQNGQMVAVNENNAPMPRSEPERMIGLTKMIHELAEAKKMPDAE